MKLQKLEVKSFGGINPKSPIVLDFTESRWITASGDFGTRKTSLLNALLVATGALSHTSKDGNNFINTDSETIDVNLTFIGKDKNSYEVRATKSRFELKYEGKGVVQPLTKMRELLGVVGTTPMPIKNGKLSDIIDWLASYSNQNADEFRTKLSRLKDGIKKSRNSRAEANKIAKAMKEYLENEEMYNDWEGSEKKYSEEPKLKELSAKLQTARTNSEMYARNEVKVSNVKDRKKKIEEEIAALNKELNEVELNIKTGEEWLESNKEVQSDYDQAKEKYDNAALDLSNYNQWQQIKQKKADMDTAETLSQNADIKEKELLREVKELQKEILPDVKNVELVTEDDFVDGVLVKEGLYWEGKNAAQMSETEFWNFVIMVWRKYKVKVVVIDNFQNLGSKAVELLEKLHKEGAHILASEMDRETKELQISYE
jgi:DNA repair exonuclease SbcCD ATPase subunit